MNVSVRPNLAAGSAGATQGAPAYLSGFGNQFETEALSGAQAFVTQRGRS